MIDEIIDPPVTPFSSSADIENWLRELRARPRSESVSAAIEEAEDFLNAANEREKGQ